MSAKKVDGYGQITEIERLEAELPDQMVGVSKVFARAKKKMSIEEFKTFVYCLCRVRWTEPEMPKSVYLDKKTLAKMLKISTDPVNIARNLRLKIGDMVDHSIITFSSEDKKKWERGALVTRVAINEERVVVVDFNPRYAGLFCNLKKDFIMIWVTDIIKMNYERSFNLYEFLRLHCDTRVTNARIFSIEQLRDIFDIPADGAGSYLRKDGRFDRHAFETKVLDPICADMLKCKMVQLVMQTDKGGNELPYRRVKEGRRLIGYELVWEVTDRPGISDAHEAQETKRLIEKNPKILKIARDAAAGVKRGSAATKKNQFTEMETNQYDFEALERELIEPYYDDDDLPFH